MPKQDAGMETRKRAMSNPPVAPKTTNAQARSAAYGLVSHGFQYPEAEAVDMLGDSARWSSWPEVLHELYGTGLAACHLDAVRAALRPQACTQSGNPAVASCAPPSADPPVAEPAGLQESFNRLFGHAVRGRCPPYELEYGGSEIIQQASGLADIAGFYSAFGMEISRDADDRPDHVAIESEFMSVLCAKEAYAIEKSEADHVDVSVKAQRDFLKDHLACWVPAFSHRVAQADPDGFYGALARFASAFVAAECDRFEITVGPKTLKLRPADPVLDTSISCGPTGGESGRAEDELVQLNLPCDNHGDQ